MPELATGISEAVIQVNGSILSTAYSDKIHAVEIDRSLHMPAMAMLEFYDDDLSLVNDSTLDVGGELVVSMVPNFGTEEEEIFKGMIVAIEPVFERDLSYCRYIVRAYDKLFGMHRGRSSAVYVQMTDSDIASQVAGDAGLSAQVEATSIAHDHVIRDDLSDYDFLKMLARRNGYVVWVEGTTLHFKSASSLGTETVTMEYGRECLEFRPNLSLFGQVNNVTVQGWDPQNKAAVSGQATSPALTPTEIGQSQRGGALAASKISSATFHIHELVNTQAKAEGQAKAILDAMSSTDVTAEGTAVGHPGLKPGCKLDIARVGTRFSGAYLVTRVIHRIDPDGYYSTDFWVGGMSSGTVASLVADEPRNPTGPARTVPGVVRAIVTNAEDPDALNRVKIKYPWLSDTAESYWAPVVSVGAGPSTGIQFLPEVNDEVLVGFAHGDMNYPFVLGGLWNGRDASPEPQGNAVQDGIRTFQTRNGNYLKFQDNNAEQIVISDKAGENLVKIDIQGKKITIKSAGDIDILAEQGNITMKAQNIKLEATQGFDGSGNQASVEAKSKLTLKGAITEMSADGMAKISGGTVMIN